MSSRKCLITGTGICANQCDASTCGASKGTYDEADAFGARKRLERNSRHLCANQTATKKMCIEMCGEITQTLLFSSRTGPPELPGLMAASICMARRLLAPARHMRFDSTETRAVTATESGTASERGREREREGTVCVLLRLNAAHDASRDGDRVAPRRIANHLHRVLQFLESNQ